MPKIITAAIAAFLLMTTQAVAHDLVSGTATCTGASATYQGFNDQEKPISYTLKVDNVTKVTGSYTFQGSSGTLTITYDTPLAAGNHVIQYDSTWPGKGSENNGSFTKNVLGCEGPPEQPTPVTPPTTQTPAPPVETSTPVAVETPPAETSTKRTPKPDNHPRRRFGKHRTKKCVYGRRQLRDSHGRRFTMCRSHPVTPVYRSPRSLTG